MSKIQDKYKIISNEKICPKFYLLKLDAPRIAKTIRPGQFIHIKVSETLVPFFRRPFSVYRAKKSVEVLYEAIGVGTKTLSTRKPGEYLDILGPLGNSFSLPPKETRQVVMIGGGIGVAPFLMLSDHIVGAWRAVGARHAVPLPELILLYGGRTKGHVYDMKEFKKNGCKVYIATDDGSVGAKGRVSELFSKINADIKTTKLYTCGPRPMMRTVKEFSEKHNLPCAASCEEMMACGLGACLGCSIRTTKGYKTTCYDGPVFDIREVIFE